YPAAIRQHPAQLALRPLRAGHDQRGRLGRVEVTFAVDDQPGGAKVDAFEYRRIATVLCAAGGKHDQHGEYDRIARAIHDAVNFAAFCTISTCTGWPGLSATLLAS